MDWTQIISASSVVLIGLASGIFILLRLRGEPVEDEDDLERTRSIENGLDLRRPLHKCTTLFAGSLDFNGRILS
jgi:hypothetical protein